jgi:Homeodomain-like domain
MGAGQHGMAAVAAPLVLRPGDGVRLRELTRSSAAPAGHMQRAQMLLLAADGLPNTEIGRRVGMTRQTVIAWRARYEAASPLWPICRVLAARRSSTSPR